MASEKASEKKPFKAKEVLNIHGALLELSKVIKEKSIELDATINYAIGRNLKRSSVVFEKFTEENNLRINSFAKKDDQGQPIIANGQWVFGENKDEAEKIYKKLLDEDVEYSPYTIKRSSDTDKLPVDVLSVLLDVIILEDK